MRSTSVASFRSLEGRSQPAPFLFATELVETGVELAAETCVGPIEMLAAAAAAAAIFLLPLFHVCRVFNDPFERNLISRKPRANFRCGQ